MIQNNIEKNDDYERIMGIFKSMIHRTTVDKPLNKYWYGKGIKVCDEWLNDPDKFYLWSINHGYKSDLTIDRIDNNKDYEPSNCQWITKSENSKRAVHKKGRRIQSNYKKRKNLRLFRMQQGLLSKEMAEKLGVNPGYYSNVENGLIDPSFEFIEKFGNMFRGQYEDFWYLFKKEE